jgi:hypothetical protein
MLDNPKQRLQAGDNVNVYFEYTPCIFGATIIYTPCSPDDSFILRTKDNRIAEVKMYSKIEQVKDGN